jgi:hypothetical protein
MEIEEFQKSLSRVGAGYSLQKSTSTRKKMTGGQRLPADFLAQGKK